MRTGSPLATMTTENGGKTVAASSLVKRSVTIKGHRTSVSLEDAFWRQLRDAAERRGQSLSSLIAEIDAARGAANLSSSIRVFVLELSQYCSSQ